MGNWTYFASRYVTSGHVTSRQVTLRHLTSRYVTSRHVALRHVTSRYVTLRHLTSRHVTPRHVTIRHVTSPHITLRHLTSRHVTPRHVTIRHVTSPHLTSRYVTLCHVMSRYITLRHLTPCHITSCHLTVITWPLEICKDIYLTGKLLTSICWPTLFKPLKRFSSGRKDYEVLQYNIPDPRATVCSRRVHSRLPSRRNYSLRLQQKVLLRRVHQGTRRTSPNRSSTVFQGPMAQTTLCSTS